jgi:hypothetical protein
MWSKSGTALRKSGTGTESGPQFHKMWDSDLNLDTSYFTKFGKNDQNVMLFPIVEPSVSLLSACHIMAGLQKIHKLDRSRLLFKSCQRSYSLSIYQFPSLLDKIYFSTSTANTSINFPQRHFSSEITLCVIYFVGGGVDPKKTIKDNANFGNLGGIDFFRTIFQRKIPWNWGNCTHIRSKLVLKFIATNSTPE